VLLVFAPVVIVGGSNFVGVRFSNRELAPFYGAGIRFVGASLRLLALSRVLRLALPRGRALFAMLACSGHSISGSHTRSRIGDSRAETWIALGDLVVGSAVLFVGFFFIIRRWTASASSYATVLFPVVALVVGALVGGEAVRPSFLLGAALVVAGVYVGALAPAVTPTPVQVRTA
jgi:drug/metabolite transporter (DMT)-like permease